MSASTPDTDPHAAALQRLTASRQRLRQQLLKLHSPAESAADQRAALLPRRLRALWRAARRHLHASPLALTAVSAVQGWWQLHPWRSSAELLAREVQSRLTPALRRRPLTAILLAALLGVALVRFRPWRWPLLARQIQPLPRRVGHWLMWQMGQPGGQALLSSLALLWAGRAARRADGAEPGSEPPAPSR